MLESMAKLIKCVTVQRKRRHRTVVVFPVTIRTLLPSRSDMKNGQHPEHLLILLEWLLFQHSRKISRLPPQKGQQCAAALYSPLEKIVTLSTHQPSSRERRVVPQAVSCQHFFQTSHLAPTWLMPLSQGNASFFTLHSPTRQRMGNYILGADTQYKEANYWKDFKGRTQKSSKK